MVTYSRVMVEPAANVASLSDDNEAVRDEAVFKALADGTRRVLLDALFVADGQSLAALSQRCPTMSRFGVMKHLDVLIAAQLVTTRKVGRQRLHFLNPVPIQQIADRWISKYAQPFTRALLDLKAAAEAG
jgi:DNA-binding transcriptional ArsR family regulator